MAFQPGHKFSPGRPKGCKNKRTLQLEIMAEKFPDPFELLMLFATGDWKALGYDSEVYVMEGANGATKIGYTISPEMRLVATKEAIQYLYPKKKDSSDEEETFEVHSIEDKKKLLEEATKEIEKLKDEIELNQDVVKVIG
jgi:hypothetical protein